jgi:hypothetical protein
LRLSTVVQKFLKIISHYGENDEQKRVSVPRELIGIADERGTDAGEGALVLQFRSVRLARGDASLFWVPALFSALQGHFVSEKKSNPIGLLDFWVVWVKKGGRLFLSVCIENFKICAIKRKPSVFIIMDKKANIVLITARTTVYYFKTANLKGI